MAGTTSGGDPWRITGEDRAKHDSQFFQLKPINGFVTGEQARGFFMQSGLPTAVLGQIWTLADMNTDGKMDKKEFSIAMHLIKKKLQGYELPKVLPAGLKADPTPMMGSFGTMPGPTMGMPAASAGGMGMSMPVIGSMAPTSMVGSSMTMPIMANGVMGQQGGFMGAPMMGTQKLMENKPRAGSFGTIPQVQPQVSSQGYFMPHQSKLKYTQMFNTHDRNKRGNLTGVEARALLVQSGLPQHLLAQIWTLSDIDKDGKLTCEEFCISMHLVDIAKSGRVLPSKLPPDLLNEFKGRSDSFGNTPHTQPPPAGGHQKDAFGDLLGSMGMPLAPVQVPATEEEKQEDIMKAQITFEDRRKENFDKGQAELDRRRQMLQEQLQQENKARMEKERQEQEKRERVRQEQERKRLQELERQLEKQRQMEREKEEQRQKMLAQREAARQEIERQRQMEWERQRKEQLLSEKGREYEQLGGIKSQCSNLKCEHESLQGKKSEIAQKIEQIRNGVTEFTGSIDAMRITRDKQMEEINKLQKELQDMKQKFTHQQRDREALNIKVQTTIQSNPLSDTHRTVLHSVELKKTTIQRLKKDLLQIEQATEAKLLEIDNNNTVLESLNSRVGELQNTMVASQKANNKTQKDSEDLKKKQEKERQEKIRKEFEAQRKKEEIEQKQKEVTANKSVFKQQEESAWFDFGSQNTPAAPSDDIWGSAFGSTDQSTNQKDIWSSSGKATDDIWSSSGQTSNKTDNKKEDIWSNAFSSQSAEQPAQVSNQNKNKKQYKALYPFEARNTDELTLNPGDIVWVPEDQTGAEPGWFGGEKDGKSGWFPQAYVEEVQNQSSQFTTDAFSVATSDSFPDKGHLDNFRSTESPFNTEVSPSPTPGQGQTAPEGLQAQALYPWKAKKDNHLTFSKGDIILVKEQQDMWWSGEINGKIGWFPKSYVKLVSGPSSKTSSRSQTPDGTLDRQDTATIPQIEESHEGVNYVAAYNYSSSEPVDLTFNQGDVILVTKMDGDWWTGTLAGRSGIFPANYVKKMEGQQDTVSTITTSIAETGLVGTVSGDTEVVPPINLANTLIAAITEDDSVTKLLDSAANKVSELAKHTEDFSSGLASSNSQEFGTQSAGVDLFAEFDFSNSNIAKSEETQVNFYIGEDELKSGFKNTNQKSDHESLSLEKKSIHFDADLFSSVSSTSENQKEQKSDSLNFDPDLNNKVPFDVDIFSSFSPSPAEMVNNNKSEHLPCESDLFSSVSADMGGTEFDQALNTTLSTDTTRGTNASRVESETFDDKMFGSLSAPSFEKVKTNMFASDVLGLPQVENNTGKSEFNTEPVKLETNLFSSLQKPENVETDTVPSKVDIGLFSSSTEQQSEQVDSKNERIQPNTGTFSFLIDFASSKSDAGTGATFSDLDAFSSISKIDSENVTKINKEIQPNTDPLSFLTDFNVSKSDAGTGALFSNFDAFSTSDSGTLDHFADAFGSQAYQNIPEQTSGILSSFNNEATQAQRQQNVDGDPALGNWEPDNFYEEVENKMDDKSKMVDKFGNSDAGLSQDDIYEDVEYKVGDSTKMTNLFENKIAEKPGMDDVYEDVDYKHCDTSRMSDVLDYEEPSQKSLKKPEIATVIAPYTATGPEQLSLNPGQLIQVRKKSPSGWWEGELQARGQKKKIGWFPANYVKLLGSSSRRSTPDTMLSDSQSSSPANTLNRTATPTIPAPQPPPQDSRYVDQVIALYPYVAQNDDELTFHKDTVINVINKDDANWWHGEQNGHTGVFPSNYVGPLTMSPPHNTWSTDPAVLAQTSAQESKRQNYIHELINTEETYMSDMSIVLEAFYNPMADAKVMTEEELNSVFVNWKELIQCNRKLLKALRVRKTMCGEGQVIQVIGDILCENLPHLTPYIRFCSCQLSAAALIQHKTQTSQEFKDVQKLCVQNPKTKGMPMSSFLLKPMQRITKYPLMISKILEYTPEEHPDHQNLTDALAKAEELCSQVNEGVRERENSNRLEWIQRHVHCDGLSEKLIFNSVTNCLGPRKLVYSGKLCKLKSNKELIGMLFNDFLLLSQLLSGSSSANLYDQKSKTFYRMYKNPIFLNEVAVKKSSDEEADLCQFHLSHIDRVFNLKATNQTERDNWVKHIEAASRHYLETERKKREKAHSLRRTGGVGRLLVVIVEGTDLIASDENGKSDPYCEVSMGVQEHRTKVINATLNPKWNSSMQFTIKDMEQDVLCITVFDRDIFTPNDFLGRTEVRVKEIFDETRNKRGPIQKRLLLHEVKTGEVLVKLDLQLYENT